MQATTIEKLSGQANYGPWSFAMEMLLIECDLWECVDGSFTLETLEARKKDAKARSKICLMCSQKVYPLITNQKTARDTWQALQRAYADGGLLRRLHLLRKLFNVKLVNYTNMEDYVNDIQSTSQALLSIKAGLDDEFIAIIMLAGLTENYNPLVMTLEHSSINITTETVMAALLKENQRKNTTEIEQDSALMSNKSSRKKDIICHLCKKKGHFKWQCREKQKKAQHTAKDSSSSSMDNNGTHTRGDSVGLIIDSVADNKYVSLLSGIGKPNEWVIDSGATAHMTPDKHILENVRTSYSKTITTANNDSLYSNQRGDVFVKGLKVKFDDVLLIPNLITNLLSVSKMCAKNCVVLFNDKCCQVFKNTNVSLAGKPLLTAPLKQGLYVLDPKEAAMVLASQPEVTHNVSNSPYDLWHRRLGHMSAPLMVKLKDMVSGISFRDVNQEPCARCCEGKQCVKKFPKRKKPKRAKELLELVHSDLAGPIEVESWGGNRYFLIFVDDFSRKVFGYAIKSKTEVFAKFKAFKAFAENQTGKKIKKLRSDNGTEYTNTEFQIFLKQSGIQHQTSVPYTPQQNGVAERTIRTIVEKARCMLFDAGLDKKFWGEAMYCATYLKNRCPTMAIPDKVPEEMFTGEKQDLSNLRVFGTKAHVLVKSNNRKKFDAKSVEMIFTGYCENQKAFRFLNLNDNPRKAVFARDATFMENVVPVVSGVKETQITELGGSGSDSHNFAVHYFDIRAPYAVTEPIAVTNEVTEVEPMSTTSETEMNDEPLLIPEEVPFTDRRYPARERRPKVETDMVYNFLSADSDPITVAEVLERGDKKL
jgi:transposase InsO family protein